MFKTLACTIAVAACCAGYGFAQESNLFHIRVGAALTGTEEYQVTTSADGVHVAGTLHVQTAAGAYDVTHDEVLAADRTLVRYKLETRGQVIEAWRDGDTIQMKVSVGTQQQSNAVPFTPAAVVVDNLVTAHAQVVLDRLGTSTEPTTTITVVVPQVLAAIPGKLAREAEGAGTLNGKAVRVRKYTLQVANTLEEIWAEVGTNRLMRLTVPVQKVEIVRDGFVPAPETPPAPRGPAAFVERPIEVRSTGPALPGTLCLPAQAKGKVALVVLVHGSGPNDRDETIGPNKPFRDLAEGLAAAGIGALRYDKRTFAFKGKLDAKTMTVEEETLADAVAAVRFARTLPEVDPARVFVLGHSQGAMFAPVIADRSEARGAILMAAAERPLDEVVLEQVAFQMRATGASEEQIQAQDGELKKAFARVRSGEAKDDENVFGASARYWRDFLGRDTRAALTNMKAPALVLQGGRDVQVRKADYDLALQALTAKPAAMREAHFFPNLNHLFMPAEEQSTGAEYGKASHVPPEVIDIIAKWVAARN